MSGEIIAIITVGVALAGLNLTRFHALGSEIARRRAGITFSGNAERMARLEGSPREAITPSGGTRSPVTAETGPSHFG